MIPIHDSVRSRSFPYVNVTIIGINFLVFFYELSLGTDRQISRFMCDWGAIPWQISDAVGQAGPTPLRMFQACPLTQSHSHALLTLVTSTFIHAGWLHILGNMLFLWIFGDNVEDAMGHLGYAVFYLLVGIAAGATQVAFNVNDTLPAVGASGAIAGVMGAYLVLFPRATIIVLMFCIIPLAVPAVVLIGLWFLLQLFSGAASVGHAVGGSGGVAWFAHVGGFIAGVVLVWIFRRPGDSRRRLRPVPPDDLW